MMMLEDLGRIRRNETGADALVTDEIRCYGARIVFNESHVKAWSANNDCIIACTEMTFILGNGAIG